MNRTLILGLDPGFSGALAIYDVTTATLLDVFDLPLLSTTPATPKTPAKRTEFDPYALSTLIELFAPKVLIAFVEAVSAAPGQGVTSMFRFGYGAGILYGALASHGITARFVHPAVWKSQLNLSRDKQLSLDMARKLFPNKIDKFKLQKHDGRAEAALIAYYGAGLIQHKLFKAKGVDL